MKKRNNVYRNRHSLREVTAWHQGENKFVAHEASGDDSTEDAAVNELKDKSSGAKCAYDKGVFDVNVENLTAHLTALKFWERKRKVRKVNKTTGDVTFVEKDTEDNIALREDVRRRMVLTAIEVIPSDKEGEYTIIDGVSRWTAAKELGYGLIPCRVVDVAADGVDGLILAKNLMRHRLTTGQRVMRLISEQGHKIIADIEEGRLIFGDCRPLKSRDLSSEYTPERLSKTLGCSVMDTLLGLELYYAKSVGKIRTVNADGSVAWVDASDKERESIAETFENVSLGITPIRRCRAAAGGAVATKGEHRSAPDHTKNIISAIKTIENVFKKWHENVANPTDRFNIANRFLKIIKNAPADVRAIVELK